ncbi:MAG: thioredoxin domain-containing protein [Schleiferiaceae bacterium]
MEHKANALINETSPYLLQHAYNPVNWHPYGQEALDLAKDSGKLVIISIGYSTCHWCHVMERESFENDSVAEFMNQHFVSIKIDREERPDLDNYYINAVQLMTQRGGWPLNVVTLPDGRTVWGGTYFPADQWVKSLQAVWDVYQSDPEKVIEYAGRLEQGIAQTQGIALQAEAKPMTPEIFENALVGWKSRFDTENGGPNRAPKFPIPNNYSYLLQRSQNHPDPEVTTQIKTTLDKMALGGIYDQIGGGFSRYSVDVLWKIPHFEKMLYDNGQLLTLYSEAYRWTQNPNYQAIIDETAEWIDREMTHEDGGFYSALDADSEGEEGLFYLWTPRELKNVLGEEYDEFEAYYRIESDGFWEKGRSVLFPSKFPEDFAKENELDTDAFAERLAEWKFNLLEERSQRIRPGLDDKILTSWNALTITGLLEAYRSTQNPTYLHRAEKALAFIHEKLTVDGQLMHTFKEKATIPAFLDDYATLIQAEILAYQITGTEDYLHSAQSHTKEVFKKFSIADQPLFNYTENGGLQIETDDNVIPSPNAIMATNLWTLGILLDQPEYRKQAEALVEKMSSRIPDYAEGYSQWLKLGDWMESGTQEVAIVGPNAAALSAEIQREYLPHVIFSFSEDASELPLLGNRYQEGKTLIYVCENYACQLPVETVEEALSQLKK